MKHSKTAILIITALLLLPVTAQANTPPTQPVLLSIINKISSIALITPPQKELQMTEIIDTYSGIKIQTNQNTVAFSYLGPLYNTPKKIAKADPKTFELIETGTYIIAKDKNALYLIHGDKYHRNTEIDYPTLEIIHNEETREIEYLKDKNKTYIIKNSEFIAKPQTKQPQN